MLKKNMGKLLICTIFLTIINALSFQVSWATPGSITTLFAHDDRQFHGNMFDVTVITPLTITGFDINLGWGDTIVTVYYRNGSYVGSETNPDDWTVMGSAPVSGEGPNNPTSVLISSPLLQPGTYGFYISVTPTLNVTDSTDMYYTSGSMTVSNADISITAGIGVGGMFGDVTACQHYSRNYPNDPCIFPDRRWNGTIYYDTDDASIIDSDGDGVPDNVDQCPGFNDNIDVDNDGIPDDCDPLIDSDGDGVSDDVDQCPGFNDNIDVDNDRTPDHCDPLVDSDGDGVEDSADQCPGFNDSIDVDNDGIPDDCDPLIDSDGDGVSDAAGHCPGFNDNIDVDNDGIPADCGPPLNRGGAASE